MKRYLWLVDTLRNAPEGLTLAEINEAWANPLIFIGIIWVNPENSINFALRTT